MRSIFQGQAFNAKLFISNSSDHITGASGLSTTSLSVGFQICKDNATSFTTTSRACTEVGGGWYHFTCISSDSNIRGDLVVRVGSLSGYDTSERMLFVGGEMFSPSWVYSATATGFEVSVNSVGKWSVLTTPSEVRSWQYF